MRGRREGSETNNLVRLIVTRVIRKREIPRKSLLYTISRYVHIINSSVFLEIGMFGIFNALSL